MDSVIKGLMGQCLPQNVWTRTAPGFGLSVTRIARPSRQSQSEEDEEDIRIVQGPLRGS